VRFTDRTVLRLLDDSELAGLLDAQAGRALLDAAFVFGDIDVGDVDSIVARTIALGPALAPDLPLKVSAWAPGASQEWQVAGSLRQAPAPAVHAVLEVSVTAAARGVVTSVTAVESESLRDMRSGLAAAADFDAGLDVLAGRLTSAPRAALAEVLRGRGITDLDRLRAAFAAPREPSRLLVTLVSDATAAPAPKVYRLTVAAQVVEDLSGGLLAAVTALTACQDSLTMMVDPQPAPSGATLRQPYPGLLLFPRADLDDADLPVVSGQHPATDAERRASRLSELTSRLRITGIVPVAI